MDKLVKRVEAVLGADYLTEEGVATRLAKDGGDAPAARDIQRALRRLVSQRKATLNSWPPTGEKKILTTWRLGVPFKRGGKVVVKNGAVVVEEPEKDDGGSTE